MVRVNVEVDEGLVTVDKVEGPGKVIMSELVEVMVEVDRIAGKVSVTESVLVMVEVDRMAGKVLVNEVVLLMVEVDS
jgi:hypothetical protein